MSRMDVTNLNATGLPLWSPRLIWNYFQNTIRAVYIKLNQSGRHASGPSQDRAGLFFFASNDSPPYVFLEFLPTLFPTPCIFFASFIFPVYADSLVPPLLNYALLFPQPEELTAEALFLTLFCIPSMCYNLFWVLFAAKMLTQLQFCFPILIG